MKRTLSCFAATILCLLPAHAAVLPSNAIVGGKTIGEWSAEFWKWAFTAPFSQHPGTDLDGSRAHVAQPDGPVFFLAGVFQISGVRQRTFTVPEGKYLFIPLLSNEQDNVNTVPPFTVDELRNVAKLNVDLITELHASIDGIPVTNLFAHRAVSPVFAFDFVSEDNLMSFFQGEPFTGLVDPIVADGCYLMVEPLPRGTHVINFGGTVGPPVNFFRDITATITVVPDPNQYVIPTNAVIGGRSIDEWTAEWWKWAWTTSTNQNPFLDTTGAWASVNQPDGEVFFLAGLMAISDTAKRSFPVPQGKYLLFPVINNYCDNVGVPDPMTPEELRQCAAANINAVTELHASIDGIPITNLFGRRHISPVFAFEHKTADNLESWIAGFPVEGPIDPAVSDGYWIMLSPLAPGTHVLNFGGTIGQHDHFTIDITDAITVVPSPNPYVMPDDAIVDGKPIGDWTAEWSKWIYSIPTNQNPLFDVDGSRVHYGQGGPVFFVPGGPPNVSGPPVTLTYAVPEGRNLLVPILNSTWDNIDVGPPPFTVEQLRDNNAATVRAVTELHASVDGIPVPFMRDPVSGFFNHRAISPVFSFNFTNVDNINTFQYGHPVVGLIDPIVGDGYWLMLAPLPLGEHEVQTVATIGFPSFSRSVIHKITVVPDPDEYASPPHSTVLGKSIADWTVDWWKWVYSQPTNQNPALDPDGRWAHRAQEGPVFYVAGSFIVREGETVRRTYSVPEGKHMLFPVNIIEVDNIDVDPPWSLEQMRDFIENAFTPRPALYFKIDGVAVTNVLEHRELSPGISFVFESPNNLKSLINPSHTNGITGLLDPIAMDGWWMMLKPLPPGTHVIEWGGMVNIPGGASFSRVDTITVVPDPNQHVMPANAIVGGKTIGEWTAECWKWVWSISTNENPQLDFDGLWANNRQPSSEVFFIAPLNGATPPCTRTFTVPENRRLLVPLLPITIDNINVVPPLSIEEMYDQIAEAVRDPRELHATIDGVTITNLVAHRATSPPFSVDFGPICDNALTVAYGQCITNLVDPIIVDGYWLMIEPLPRGEHTVRVGGKDRQGYFQHDLTLNITVTDDQYVLAPDARLCGKTQADMSAEWWQHNFSLSTNAAVPSEFPGRVYLPAGPRSDCPVYYPASRIFSGTNDPIFTIPEHGYTFFPIQSALCDNVNVGGTPMTPEELRDCAAALINAITNIYATIDGRSVGEIGSHRQISPLFSFDFRNPDNIYTWAYGEPFTGLVDPIAADGYYLLLKPLPRGMHRLTVGASFGPPHHNTSFDVPFYIRVVSDPNRYVMPTNAVVGGRTIAEWTAEWFKSLYPLCSNAPNGSPMFDPDGRWAHNGQPDASVFFLGSGTGFETASITRTFTVPQGKYLLVPLLVATIDNIDVDPPLNADEMIDGIEAFMDNPRELHASIDGVTVTNLVHHRATTPVFSVQYNDPNNYLSFIYNKPITGLVDPVVGNGYWLMIEPLPLGSHVLRYGGAYPQAFYRPTDIIANITVVPGSPLPTNPPPMVSTNLLTLDCPSPSPANPSSLPREDFWVPDGPVNAIVETNGVLYIGGLFDYLSPSSLTGDAFDQLSGAPVPNLPKINGAIKVIEPDRVGGWFVGGIFNSVGSHPLRNLAHVRADGTVDATWAPDPDGGVLTLVAAPDKLYVGGTFKTIGGQPRSLVAALDPGTGAVLPFRADAHTTFPKPSVNALLLSEGILYLAGYFSFINGAEREHIGAVDAETGAVTPWHPNGYTGSQAGSRIDALAILENILFVGGTFTSIGGSQTNGPARNFIAALNVNGPDFGSVIEWDPNADAPVTSLAATCDTLYVGGAFTRIGGQPRNRIAALDLVTGRATAWNPNANGDVLSLRLAGNTLYAGGKFTEIGGAEREFLAALDTKTGQAGLFSSKADFGIAGLAVSGGTVYAGGGVAGGGVLRKNLAALDVRTGRPLNWAPTVGGESIINAFPFRGAYALAASADTLFLGGPFTQINGQLRNHVGAIAISTGQPTSWQPDVNGIVETLAISGDKVFLGGRFTHVSGLPRQNIAAVDLVSGAPSAWNPGANDKVKTLLTCGHVLFAGGIFNTIAGAPHNRLAALEIDSGLSYNWNPALNDQVSALSLAGQTIYVGGQFSTVNGDPRNRVAALDVVSGSATCWNPGARTLIGKGERSAAVNAIAPAGNAVFLGGSYNSLGGQARNNLAASSSSCPANPTSWNPNADGPVAALAIRGDTLFAAGGFQNLNGQFRPYLAVFPPQGAPRIALQPRSEQVGIGATVTLGGEASGEGSLSFQWQFNGANIPGATSSTLTIPNAQVANSGDYTLVVTNSLGLVSSHPATLTVLQPVTILSHPRSQTVSPGRTVTLAVAASGNPPPTYQWRLNGVNIPGAIFPTLVISNAQPRDGGSYSVVAANVGGAISSDIASVRVKSPRLPFQNDLSFTQEGHHDPDENGDDGNDSSYEGPGSERDLSLSGNRKSQSHQGRIISASGVGHGNNQRADKEADEPNHAGKQGGKSVWIHWLAPASGIATFSTRGSSFDTLLAVYTGNDFTDLLGVAADEDRGGFATSDISFNANAGTEYLLAVDGLGGASGDIVLSWSLDTSTVPFPRITLEPRHQTVTPKATVAFEVDAVSTTPLRFQWFFGCRLLAGETNRLLTIPNVSARNVGGYRCLVMNDSTHIAESLEALLEIGPDAQIVSQDKLEDIVAALSGPSPFAARAAALSGSGSIINVAMGNVTPPQLFDNTGSSTSANEPNHCAVLGGASKWFAVRPLENATLVVDTIGSSIDTVLAVYTGPNALQLAVVACDDNGAPDRIRSLARFEARNTTNYWVVVDGVQGSVGNIQLNWKLGRGPTIISAPRPATPRLGQTFVLEITSTNAIPDPTYQWFHNGIAMIGATNATLSISNVQGSHAGTYSVVVENYAGSTNHSFGTFEVALPIAVIPAIVSNNGTNYLQLTGDPAKKYVIEACTDFLQWVPLYTNTADTTAPINFLNPQTNAWRYYRVVPLP